MIMHVSRYASGQQEWSEPPESTEPVLVGMAEPLLLTHVWHRFFVQRTRRDIHR
jgi:hypothetical protein